jgi:hypothetical protein
MNYYLTVELRSDATFGRGEGVPGLVDLEIEHDHAGCPQIGGRALKGLLLEELANIRYALGDRWSPDWDARARWLFGQPGALLDEGTAAMHVGVATLPPDLRAALHADVAAGPLSPDDVLGMLTTIRRQTSVDAGSGAPERGSLRAMRALLRDTPLIATLTCPIEPERETRALLAACVLAVRRGGTARNRGRGRLRLRLHRHAPEDYLDDTFTHACYGEFAALIQPV